MTIAQTIPSRKQVHATDEAQPKFYVPVLKECRVSRHDSDNCNIHDEEDRMGEHRGKYATFLTT